MAEREERLIEATGAELDEAAKLRHSHPNKAGLDKYDHAQTQQDISNAINAAANAQSAINAHAGQKDNPHGVTAVQAGAEPAQTLVTEAEAVAGTSTARRAWTPQRVRKAIEAVVGGEEEKGSDVRSTKLTGLSIAVNAVITAADTVISAFGKLQAQVNRNKQNTELSGVCSTAAGTAAKIVGIAGFSREIGARISVLFVNGNTAATPTLNANAHGAGQIWFRGAIITNAMIPPNHVADLIWDGTRWQLLNPATGEAVWSGQCTTAVGTADKTVTISGFAAGNRVIGQMVEVEFTVGNSSSSATLNVTSTGAAEMRYNNAAPVLIMQRAMYRGLYVWDGTYWQLINPATGFIRGQSLNTLKTTAKMIVDAINEIVDNLAKKAPLADPTFTGAPKAPTASSSTNSTQLATTAFVKAALDPAPAPQHGTFTGDGSATRVINLGRRPKAILIMNGATVSTYAWWTHGIASDGKAWAPIVTGTAYTLVEITNVGFTVSWLSSHNAGFNQNAAFYAYLYW